MLNSRDITALRKDVAVNCQKLIGACKAAGFKAELSCTFRDQEYQTYLHETQNAPALVSFHGAGLAFDVYENLNGRTSYRDEFFNFIAPLAKKMGFTWMQDITGSDKPHFQWDNRRAVTGTMVRNGEMPPTMPEYDEVAIYKATIQKHCDFSDPYGVWVYMDKHPYAKSLYRKWAESYVD